MFRVLLSALFVYVFQLLTHAVTVIGWTVLRLLRPPNIEAQTALPQHVKFASDEHDASERITADKIDSASDDVGSVNTDLECHPIRTLDDLLNIANIPIAWHSLVQPFDPAVRSEPLQLGDDYENFDGVGRRAADEAIRPKVLVCHDLAGNYRGDRFINGSTKWDDYRFYHWSGIDYFCYFSHAFCTIPPYGWLQAAHRHGVRVIGTLITESAVGRRTLDALLASEQTVSTAVDALVHLAVHCRFEGWLINIECDLDRDQIPLLTYFVQLLHNRMHAAVPHALVIWYDSILTSGQLLWQNELNQRNRGFYDVCDGILLNYNWNDGHLARTVQQLDYDAAKVANVFVGIDVFGRGQVAKDRTHETWQRIRQANASLSVGLFAPAWTFEGATELGVNIHAPHGTAVCNAYFVERNELFWDRLWPMLWSTGPTRMPFATTFCLGSGRRRHRDGLTLQASVLDGWFNMAMQSWQPSVTGGAHRRRPHFLEAFDGGSCLEVDSTTNEEQNEASTTGANFRNGPMVARLFVCDFGGDDVRDGFVLCYAYKAQTLNGGDGFAVWLKAEMSDDNGSKRYCRIECGAPFSVRPQGQSSSQTIGRRSVRLAPLTDGALRDVLIHIVERRERSLPAYSLPAASGWMVRYYYVPIGGGVRLIDVGVRNASDDHGGAAVLLGAVQLHRGSAALWHRQRRQAIIEADFH